MFRSFSRPTLQIEPTSNCNLRCGICVGKNLQRSGSMLSLEDFKKVLTSGAFRHVGLHGWGEPLLNPQLFQMVTYAESIGIYTNLTTNGTLLTGDNIDHVFSSGLRQIAFGVYQVERIPSILPRIEALVKEKRLRGADRPEIHMDITIFRSSLDRIPALIEIAAASGFDAVILHRIFNAYASDTACDMAYISDDEERELFAKAKKTAKKRRLKLYLPPKSTLPCTAVKNCIFVTADGKVTPCCFFPRHVLGDAIRQGVDEVLRSREYMNFIKTMEKNPVCNSCLV